MKKSGELQIRTDAFFRAQMVLHDHGYPVDEKLALDYLRRLFPEDKKAFLIDFRRMLEMGYKESWLLDELFKSNSKRSRMKRTVYVMLMTRLHK